MSAAVAPTTGTTGTAGPARTAPRAVPFARLAAVELRKQVDTRAGIGLLIAIVVLTAGIMALVLFNSDGEFITWQELTLASSWGSVFLLPLIGVMAATSEWSQRTALTTFALEPRRTRVNMAKLVSANVLGLGVLMAVLAVGAVLNVVGRLWLDGNGSWAMDWALFGGMALSLVILVTQGVAFGLALLSTPIAIVGYLALPTLWTILSALVPALRGPSDWLDINVTLTPLTEGGMGGEEWAQLATSCGVWVLLPLAFGLWRTARRDVS
ncbi:ABC transporter permease [Georgenia faecalis]|uniref:ABC transporter permease n=1 Tax=Georgenia faecalis TaxID=2483799 RepID=A0ABV9D5A2_9MICO|nr:ABC transporter permease [Georgenia faecalis]